MNRNARLGIISMRSLNNQSDRGYATGNLCKLADKTITRIKAVTQLNLIRIFSVYLPEVYMK